MNDFFPEHYKVPFEKGSALLEKNNSPWSKFRRVANDFESFCP